jgi:hypothetical protein
MRMSEVWRQVAASAKVVFDNEKHFLDLARTRIQLSNSGNQPLGVRIKVSTDVKDTTPTANLLREHISRFQTLVIRVPTYETAALLVPSIGEGEFCPAPGTVGHTCRAGTFHAHSCIHRSPKCFLPMPPTDTPHHSRDAPFRPHRPTTKDLLHFTYRGMDVFSYNSTSNLDHPRIISMPHLISADVMGGITPHLFVACPNAHPMLNPGDDYQRLMSDSAFPRLEVLRLDAADITDSALRLGAGGMRGSLKRLELRACEGFPGDGILKIAEGQNQGSKLMINTCPGVTIYKPADLAKL